MPSTRPPPSLGRAQPSRPGPARDHEGAVSRDASGPVEPVRSVLSGFQWRELHAAGDRARGDQLGADDAQESTDRRAIGHLRAGAGEVPQRLDDLGEDVDVADLDRGGDGGGCSRAGEDLLFDLDRLDGLAERLRVRAAGFLGKAAPTRRLELAGKPGSSSARGAGRGEARGVASPGRLMRPPGAPLVSAGCAVSSG